MSPFSPVQSREHLIDLYWFLMPILILKTVAVDGCRSYKRRASVNFQSLKPFRVNYVSPTQDTVHSLTFLNAAVKEQFNSENMP